MKPDPAPPERPPDVTGTQPDPPVAPLPPLPSEPAGNGHIAVIAIGAVGLVMVTVVVILLVGQRPTGLTKDSTCRDYLAVQSSDERYTAVRTIGVEVGMQDATNPLEGPNTDSRCGALLDLTLARVLGTPEGEDPRTYSAPVAPQQSGRALTGEPTASMTCREYVTYDQPSRQRLFAAAATQPPADQLVPKDPAASVADLDSACARADRSCIGKISGGPSQCLAFDPGSGIAGLDIATASRCASSWNRGERCGGQYGTPSTTTTPASGQATGDRFAQAIVGAWEGDVSDHNGKTHYRYDFATDGTMALTEGATTFKCKYTSSATGPAAGKITPTACDIGEPDSYWEANITGTELALRVKSKTSSRVLSSLSLYRPGTTPSNAPPAPSVPTTCPPPTTTADHPAVTNFCQIGNASS